MNGPKMSRRQALSVGCGAAIGGASLMSAEDAGGPAPKSHPSGHECLTPEQAGRILDVAHELGYREAMARLVLAHVKIQEAINSGSVRFREA